MEITETKIDGVRRRFIPLTKWPKFHEWPSIAGLRNLVFFKETNGFKQVVFKSGGRVLIDEEKFFQWVKERSDWQ